MNKNLTGTQEQRLAALKLLVSQKFQNLTDIIQLDAGQGGQVQDLLESQMRMIREALEKLPRMTDQVAIDLQLTLLENMSAVVLASLEDFRAHHYRIKTDRAMIDW